MFNRKLKEQLEQADYLIKMLESFIFVARTDGKKSGAIDFAEAEVKRYRALYN